MDRKERELAKEMKLKNPNPIVTDGIDWEITNGVIIDLEDDEKEIA